MGKTIEITVPDIGDFTDVPVIEVLVAAGDRVAAEDSLITLESDKATMEVPAPQAGVIRVVRLKVGDTVSKGDVVAVLEAEAEAEVERKPEPESTSATARADAAEPPQRLVPVLPQAAPAPGGRPQPATEPASHPEETPAQAVPRGFAAVNPATVPYASPAVRQFARELGVDLMRVTGSGGKGRILREDVSAWVKAALQSDRQQAKAAAAFELAPAPKVDFARFGAVSEQPLSRIRRIAAGHLHRNWVTIPHVTQHDEADITDMEVFRREHAGEAERQGFKLTPLVFLIKASVAALKRFPQFNASLDPGGEKLIVKHYYNIGVAVDTTEGLVVPVLRDCDRRGIMELARELKETSERARAQKLALQDIQGGCFSISSLGGIGGTGFTPIINAPEVAILGVSRSVQRPVWDGAAFRPRLMLPVSLSYDHRVIDGADAARFTRFLCSALEDLRRLTL